MHAPKYFSNYWIFVAISLILVAWVCLAPGWLAVSCCLTWGIRLCFLKKLKLFVLILSLSLLLTLSCFHAKQSSTENSTPKQGLILADTVKVNGDHVTFQLDYQTSQGKRRAQGSYYCRTEKEKQFFQKNIHHLQIRFTGEKRPITPATNPGQFDSQAYYWQQLHIHDQIYVKQISALQPAKHLTVLLYIRQVRQQLNTYFESFPSPLNTYLMGLIIGQYSSGDDFSQDMSNLGIVHIFSISGLHILVILSLIYTIATLCKIPKETIDWWLLLLLPIYGVLAGSGTGIKRSVGVTVIAILLDKCHLSLNNLDKLSLILIGHLLINPYLLFSLGGILSYLLAYALILMRVSGTFRQQFYLNLCGFMPILFFHFQWHLLTLLLNLLMIPLFEIIIMPLVFLTALIGPLIPALVNILNQSLILLNTSLHQLATIRGFNFVFGQPQLWMIILATLICLIALNQKSIKIRRQCLVIYGMVLSVSFLWIHVPIFGQVSLLDVGQGDSLLITTPGLRKVVLIDTGGQLTFPRKTWQQGRTSSLAQRVTVPALKSQGITKIDMIFLTHQDTDHLGELHELLESFSVSQIIVAQGLEQNVNFKKQLQKVARLPKIQSVLAGDQVILHPLKFKVVAPFKSGTGGNEDSLVLWSQIAGKRWLFTGDIGQTQEKQLLANYELPVDYLKVAHHGSKTSSDPTFLRTIQPQLALISSGRRNRYGHPDAETLQHLRKLSIPYLNTQEYGALTWQYSVFGKPTWQTFLKEPLPIERKKF